MLTEIPEGISDDGITVENVLSKKEWVFSMKDSKKRLRIARRNLTSNIDIFIVDVNNYNFLYRVITIPLSAFVSNERIVVKHEFLVEKKRKQIKLLTNSMVADFKYKVR